MRSLADAQLVRNMSRTICRLQGEARYAERKYKRDRSDLKWALNRLSEMNCLNKSQLARYAEIQARLEKSKTRRGK